MEEKRGRVRPVKMGVSTGHWLCGCAGTAGCVVKGGEKEYVLTNCHVAALEGLAKPGDPVLQPGPLDTGNVLTDTFGRLAKFVEIKFPSEGGCPVAKLLAKLYNSLAKLFRAKTRLAVVTTEYPENEVDAALVEPTVEVSREILSVGVPKGAAIAKEGMKVVKSGRTSCLTRGEIIDDDATVLVQYSRGVAKFVHQLLIRAEGDVFVQAGDSGSAVLNEDGYVVGLLFAGTTTGRIGVANRIEKVLEALGVEIAAD